MESSRMTVLEICAGAGGQSSGLERAHFEHVCAVEIDHDASETLRKNRPHWLVEETDVRQFDASGYQGVTLLAGGVPCPPFSVAGQQLGPDDERDLFPLRELMGAKGWEGAASWAEAASHIAPTIVGGSKKHGGADLGPTRSRAAWQKLQVDGKGLADTAPGPDAPLSLRPRLTNAMVARLQGFSPDWEFVGRKTSVYRQIGNAFPPPVAEAIGHEIAHALRGTSAERDQPTLFPQPLTNSPSPGSGSTSAGATMRCAL